MATSGQKATDGINLNYDNRSMESQPYFDLGSYSRRITTRNSSSQLWFNRGLIWCYAFNHEEAIKCFQRALKDDPECIMALWGIAYALGPNYNKPWEAFEENEKKTNLEWAKASLDAARESGNGGEGEQDATPVERALIQAVRVRYQNDEEFGKWNEDYAGAMELVYGEFGYDLDVAALYADSLMNLTPWALWDLRSGEPADGARTLEAKKVLDDAIAMPGGRDHPGLLHLYTHLMELSPRLEDALPVADRLRGLVPDAGHLHHMPTHLDVLCGDWKRAIESNSEAIEADERWVTRAGALNFYSLYRSHNYHFKIYAAMFAGQSRVAIETVTMLEASLPDELLRIESPPMADWLESFLSMRVHALIRFGRWDDLLALDVPTDPSLYSVTTAMIRYGKGVAHAATGNVKGAREESKLFALARQNVPTSRTLFNNTANAILSVAAAMLEGELSYRQGEVARGFESLQKAVELSDNLPYDEPWGWMQPPRHALGALLLEQNRIDEAAAVYRADLGLDDTLPRALRHPNNVWALHGYHECLVKQRGEQGAASIEKQLKLLAAEADVEVQSSCFCRGTTR
ncbi:hypothetical protein DOTSEDRAFT_67815 [Dothistroma septosporum NZE10]|uniref:TPR domain protein n=1 Tax=Dothistroma septosporum (strain NZE10 / CBS 128990) TaxID=675120 RepID=N1PZL3_DOTSN|nr:hypothetical protein DOTSEDRAFT_67815 [Dothistroma septosporum NZE10]